MLIHAYRRRAAIEVSLFGLTLEFHPNADGAVVAEVEDERAIERLLSIDEAYVAYGAPKAEAPPAHQPPAGTVPAALPPSNPLVLKNDAGDTLDISKMTAKQVRAMAAEQDPPIALPGGNSTPLAELRRLLAEGLQGEE